MRGRLLVPIALVVAVLIALPAAALTESGFEQDVKRALGIDVNGCAPPDNLASSWVEGPGLSFARDEPRVAAIGGNAYLVGGTSEVVESPAGRLLLTPDDNLTRFDPRGGRYTELAPLPEARNHMGVVAYRGDLYALGGYSQRVDAGTGKRFFRYDPATNRWSRLPDMPAPRAAMAAGVIGDTLIVAAGARDRVPLASAFAYDFRRGRWSRLPNMGSRREHVGAAVLGGKLYVVGGRGPRSLALDTAERYDPVGRRWERLAPLPVPVGGVAAVAAKGKLIAVGGGDDGRATVSGAVQELDPASDSWSLLSALRMARHGHGLAFVDGRIWAFGGSECAFFKATDSVESLRLAEPGSER